MFAKKLAVASALTRKSFVAVAQRSFAAEATARPFRVLGIQQIAIGGPSKEALQKLWVGTFGLEKVTSFKSEKENVDEDVLRAGRGPWAVELDIMQPINPEKSPKVHIPPLNHIGLWIDDLPKAVEWMTAQGLRMAPGGIRRGASGFDVAFMHPKSTEGVLIELVQAPQHLVEAFEKLK